MPQTSPEDKDTRYAYHCIRDFFELYGLSGAVKDLGSILKAALSNKSWKKAAPYTAILFIEKLEELSAAAFTIHHCNYPRAGAVVSKPEGGVPDMSMARHFAARQPSVNSWQYFPRNLTAGQYHNPYKAIGKFTRYMPEQDWKKFFADCAEYALSNQPIDDVYPPYELLTVRRRLLQLIEACHLLDARTNINEPDEQPASNKTDE